MNDEIKKPAAPIDPTPVPVTPAAPVISKSFGGGIEPGSMRGSGMGRLERVLPRGGEEDSDVLAEVKAMDGQQMRKWLKTPGNAEKLNNAVKRKS